jgi:periplasmic divalent cation tolerance protein
VNEVMSSAADMTGVRVVFCTFPDGHIARRVATQLVEEKLVACVNLLPATESIYRWQGQVETAMEVLAIIKTSAARLPEFEKRLTELHPYEVPEIMSVEPTALSATYRAWLMESVSLP